MHMIITDGDFALSLLCAICFKASQRILLESQPAEKGHVEATSNLYCLNYPG